MAVRRRQANAEGGRPVRHEVKVTAEQELRLMVAAQRAGVTVPRLLVESALAAADGESATERKALLVELNLLRGQVSKVGVNVNQIARVANATGEISEDLHSALRVMRDVCRRIDSAMDSLALEPGGAP